MDPEYIDQPWSAGASSGRCCEHLVDPGDRDRHVGHRRHDPPPARQPARRAAEAVRRHRPRQGPAAVAAADASIRCACRSTRSSPTSAACCRDVISGSVIVSVVLSLPTTGPMLLRALQSQDMYLAGSFLMFLAAADRDRHAGLRSAAGRARSAHPAAAAACDDGPSACADRLRPSARDADHFVSPSRSIPHAAER